jgi:NAD(P)-dependent dehydrogenase (short-subunit alcohol dehydrogenase family)
MEWRTGSSSRAASPCAATPPKEIASVIEFLLDGTRSSYMTGEIVAVDGGFRGAGLMVEE